MAISVVMNADTRIGFNNDSSKVGEFENGQPNGTRSVDFLVDGLINKLKFFDGYDLQCIFYVDKHEEIQYEVEREIRYIINRIGNNSKFVFKEHSRNQYRWNDKIYIEALKLAEGNYVAHFDNDASAFKKEGSDIVERYFKWLDEGYKFICQPWDKTGDEMFWASTRFFICKKETLDLPFIEANLTTPLRGRHTPCFEHVISVLNDEKVLYPEREDDQYMIFCWSRYFKGTLEKLSKMTYDEVRDYILECGLFGCNDVFDKIPETV